MTAPLTVMVTGTRGELDTSYVFACLDALAPDFVILGDCPTGADANALLWCKNNLHFRQYKVHYADWDFWRSQGNPRAAGPKRNAFMVADAVARRRAGDEVIVLAFPRGGPGTADCMCQARAAGLAVELF